MCLAVPAKIKSVIKSSKNISALPGKEALVDFGGVEKRISLGILDGVKEGDYVLIHAGFAIGKVSKTEAEDTFKALGELKKAIAE